MDEQPKKKPLSEIGHLFLSSVRERQLGGAPLPKRTPPRAADAEPANETAKDTAPKAAADLTSAERESMDSSADEAPAAPRRTPPVTAIIGEHLNGKQLARVKDYARHLAATICGRVGLIEVDASEFRLMCFEPGEQPGGPLVEQTTDCYDPRMMAEAIEEMNFDVERWLLLMPSPRVPEAQPLLKLVDHWVLLSTCDHDGVVSSYRVLKGLADLHRPRLSLAVLDALDAAQADKVYKKLSGVCQQFLDRALESEPPVRRDYKVCEHLVMLCRPNRDKAQLANPPQWQIVGDFLMKAREGKGSVAGEATQTTTTTTTTTTTGAAKSTHAPLREMVAEMIIPTVNGPAAEVTMSQALPAPQPVMQTMTLTTPPIPTPAPAHPANAETLGEVLDLPTADASAEQIVNAVLKQDGTTMLECPVRAPMCADARLAVMRDRSVVLLAVARKGLSELNSIGQAYRWLIENRSLIGMAVPQLAIDPAQTPRLRLLVDQCDAGADVLQPMLTGDHVAVQSYRRVKWGGKAGLLLEAA